MRLDAVCGCGATLNLDSGGSGDVGADQRLGHLFEAWNVKHKDCGVAKAVRERMEKEATA